VNEEPTKRSEEFDEVKINDNMSDQNGDLPLARQLKNKNIIKNNR